LLTEIGLPGLLMIAAQMLMFIPSAPLAQNPLLYAAVIVKLIKKIFYD
jgi:hypothetical protein